MVLTESHRLFLDEPRFAVLATINPDGTPQQTVVWFALQADQIIMNTAKGRLKDLNLRRDARLSFCVEDGYRYLTIRGKATLDEVNAQRDIETILNRYFEPAKVREMMRTQFSRGERVTIRMSIDKISGSGFTHAGY
jgi:PPOX class probable F420-dependent enzyme